MFALIYIFIGRKLGHIRRYNFIVLGRPEVWIFIGHHLKNWHKTIYVQQVLSIFQNLIVELQTILLLMTIMMQMNKRCKMTLQLRMIFFASKLPSVLLVLVANWRCWLGNASFPITPWRTLFYDAPALVEKRNVSLEPLKIRNELWKNSFSFCSFMNLQSSLLTAKFFLLVGPPLNSSF